MLEHDTMQFGNYRVLKHLGSGGFADVFLGEHLYLRSQAAIKVLHTSLHEREYENFLLEARMVARLSHPHIIRVIEFGISNARPYLVMEYAPHGNLRERFQKGSTQPLSAVLPVVKQMADALSYAHNQQLIHRDVKPENMLLGSEHDVLLSDFGVALLQQNGRYQKTREIIGTPAYMAPEQLRGRPEAASDQYSLGICTYEWLGGGRPFHGSFIEIASQHMVGIPRPLHELAPLPLEVELVVHKALAKKPEQRFARTLDFALALEEAAGKARIRPFYPATPVTLEKQPAADDRTSAFRDTSVPPAASPASVKKQLSVQIRTKVLLVCLALLILLGNGLLIALPFSAKNESSLRLAIQNSATVPSGLTPPANPYKAATSGTPIIDDPLTAEDALEWNNVNGCSYRQGALHASSGLTNGEAGGICTIFSSSYTNIAFQVQVILDQGSLVAGGMVFRNDFTTGQGYMFDITNQGEVFLMLATTNSAGSVSTTMLYDSQHNAFVHSQLYQANLLTVIAEGNLLSLYVNQHLITHVTNATSPSGSVGVMCLSGDGAPSDAAFHSAQLWLL